MRFALDYGSVSGWKPRRSLTCRCPFFRVSDEQAFVSGRKNPILSALRHQWGAIYHQPKFPQLFPKHQPWHCKENFYLVLRGKTSPFNPYVGLTNYIYRRWSPLEWTASDDRVRGGSSQSYLDASPLSPTAVFYGNLDTKTLGGAGFASQRTTAESTWDLSNFDGILLDIEKTDGKKYTLTLKDEILPKRPDGREQSTVSWEYDFVTADLTKHDRGEGGEIFVPWEDFVPTYRGREMKDAKPLDLKKVKRFSLMMRR